MSDCSTNAWGIPIHIQCQLSFEETKLVIVGATRYYLGRHTGSVHSYCAALERMVPQLSEETREVLSRDISEWLAEQPSYMFGGVDDAEPWRRVRDALSRESKVNVEEGIEDEE